METIYTLNELLEKVRDDMARCEEQLRLTIRSETFFRKFPRTLTSLQAKLETLEEMERWIVEKLRKEKIFNEIH